MLSVVHEYAYERMNTQDLIYSIRQNRMRWHGRGGGVRPVVVQVHGR